MRDPWQSIQIDGQSYTCKDEDRGSTDPGGFKTETFMGGDGKVFAKKSWKAAALKDFTVVLADETQKMSLQASANKFTPLDVVVTRCSGDSVSGSFYFEDEIEWDDEEGTAKFSMSGKMNNPDLEPTIEQPVVSLDL